MPNNKHLAPENPEQVRHAIDTGQTRDKVAVPDPAASPLGTDAEAGALHDEEGLKIARAAKPPPKK